MYGSAEHPHAKLTEEEFDQLYPAWRSSGYVVDGVSKEYEARDGFPFLTSHLLPLIGMRTETRFGCLRQYATDFDFAFRLSGYITEILPEPTLAELKSNPQQSECFHNHGGTIKAYKAARCHSKGELMHPSLHGQQVCHNVSFIYLWSWCLTHELYDTMSQLQYPVKRNELYSLTYQFDDTKNNMWIVVRCELLGVDVDFDASLADRTWLNYEQLCYPPKPVFNCARDGCKASGTALCSGCRRIHFCSRNCQRESWLTHKRACLSSSTSCSAQDFKKFDEAVRADRVAEVRMLLQSVSSDSATEMVNRDLEINRFSSLFYAVDKSSLEMFELLLRFGAHPQGLYPHDIAPDQRVSILLRAVMVEEFCRSEKQRTRWLRILQLLLEGVAADVNYCPREPVRGTPLFMCTGLIGLQTLLNTGRCDLRVRNYMGRTALHCYCFAGENMTSLAECLLEFCREHDQQVVTGACERVYPSLSELINLQCNFGSTALILASQQGHLDIVDLLLRYGADPNIADQLCNTALHFAARAMTVQSRGGTCGCSANSNSFHEKMSLEVAAKITKLLLKHGAQDSVDVSGRTVADLAAINHNKPVSELLEKRVCARDGCSVFGGTRKCARCLNVFYCSQTCQRAAWPLHKLICVAPSASESK